MGAFENKLCRSGCKGVEGGGARMHALRRSAILRLQACSILPRHIQITASWGPPLPDTYLKPLTPLPNRNPSPAPATATTPATALRQGLS